MTQEKINSFINRIDNLRPVQKPKFGKMNVNQVICHCADAFRMAIGEMRAEEYGKVEPSEILALARAGKSVPVPKGFDQVKGEGTQPGEFLEDVATLKNYLIKFSKLPDDFIYAEHPFFGYMEKQRWDSLMEYHLDHHLKQFGV